MQVVDMKTETAISDATYSMRVATRMTGLTADTLRAWERRYGAVKPMRTEGNTRRYSAEDIRRLTLLGKLTAAGHSIKNIANLSERQLMRMNNQMAREEPQGDDAKATATWVERVQADYLAAITQFDTRNSKQILTKAAAFLEVSEFLLKIVLPILREVGRRWESKELNVAQEHLTSEQVKHVLLRMFSSVSTLPGASKVLVATPSGQLHEFGAMAGALLAAARGLEPIYLGPNMPEEDLLRAVKQSKAKVLLLSVVGKMTRSEIEQVAATINRIAVRIETWVGIDKRHQLARKLQNVRLFDRFEDLDIAFAEHQI